MWARRVLAPALAALVVSSAGAAYAQRGGGGFLGGQIDDFFGGFGRGVRMAPPEMPDSRFTVCRIMYQSVRREPNGGGWRTDYPGGETNLMVRLSELTRTPISRDASTRPNTWVVRLTDESLFNCPYTVASDVGTMGLSQPEADNLRLYLLKGGFLWVDDFWGSPAWEHWSNEIALVLPPSEFPIQDVPLTDPMLRSMFEIEQIPQITNIQFWRGNGGAITSERGSDSDEVHLRAIRDERGRIVVLMSHNTDIADSWEREGEDPAFFYQFSPRGYALGVDVLLHAMTH
jgi:hypothetical protein